MPRSRVLVAACFVTVAVVMAPASANAQAKAPAFVGKTWISADASAAPGTFRIFLADGTLVMDSCGETYRLAPWRSAGANLIEWQEDTAKVAAEVSQPRPDRLRLRLRLRDGTTKDEQYQLAKVPYVCPETKASPPATMVSASGRVFFLERLALPPSATVRVELRDISRVDAPARTLATQTFTAKQGPPFTFALSAPKADLDPRASLAVFADIRDGQRLMFITDTRYAVPLEGASNMEVRLRFVASASAQRAPGIVTPAPSAYRCGDETFKLAFEEGQAFVTLSDGSLTTLKRLTASGSSGKPRQFTNGRLTFFLDDSSGAPSRVSFARGRMAAVACTPSR